MYRLKVVVEEVRGFCDLPAKVGDYFEIDGGRLIVPPGKHVCIWALQAMMPFLTVKQRKIDEANDWTPTTSRICCPDPNGMVIYRVDPVGVIGGTGDAAGTGNTGGATEVRLPQTAPDEGIPYRMLVDPSKCSGCRRCELECSFVHLGKYWPEFSRVKVSKDEASGIDAPNVCRQCGTAKCVEACPAGALVREPETKAVLLLRDKCLQCLACVAACHFGAIHRDAEGYPLLCDLCGGDPSCVKACPTSAIWFGRAGDAPAKPRFAQPGKENPVPGSEGKEGGGAS
ncbi:MAG: TIGR04076 family protein [Bacillota bacterium]